MTRQAWGLFITPAVRGPARRDFREGAGSDDEILIEGLRRKEVMKRWKNVRTTFNVEKKAKEDGTSGSQANKRRKLYAVPHFGIFSLNGIFQPPVQFVKGRNWHSEEVEEFCVIIPQIFK
ncbi:unnamed protein product [Larinioides sclopetarius]|uniref:Uncharacterized protein n=1 Tax=Larinioides sclopetarius TaxID=280406 RepID=A0AAV2A755_9ARAC